MDILMMAAAIVVAAFIGVLVMFGVVFAILLMAMYITSIIRYIFGPDIDEYGNLRECIGCNAYRYRRDKDLELTELEYCQKRCRAYMRAQKKLKRRTKYGTD